MRISFRRREDSLAVSVPLMASVPDVGSSIRVSWRAKVDLPEPDSPTMASVLPA
ncbi:hypothetical protein l11_14570 [Neisseria weaveri LMG 5135]|nr:hypothetical protein l11_14570 [Neisseria weaveri LMG 5135]